MDTEPKRRWYCPTPGWLVLGSLATTAFFLLSGRFRWFSFNEHKGWTVLIAVAGVGAVLAVMLLWLLAALVFRWRFQFTIRTLLVLAVAVALPCSWLSMEIQAAKRQNETVTAINTLDGSVEYDCDGGLAGSPQPAEPPWLRQLLVIDFFHDVIAATVKDDDAMAQIEKLTQLKHLQIGVAVWPTNWTLAPKDVLSLSWPAQFSVENHVTDAGMEHVKGLTQLEYLELAGDAPKITDAGLRYVKGLRKLRTLRVAGAGITDAGLESLTGLSQLEELDLGETGVSNAGLESFKQALPTCRIWRERERGK